MLVVSPEFEEEAAQPAAEAAPAAAHGEGFQVTLKGYSLSKFPPFKSQTTLLAIERVSGKQ